MGRLDGKVALISGTGGGQGRAAARIFAREGARIIGCDLKVDGNRETARLVQSEGGTFVGLEPLDLAEPAEAKRFVETAIDRFGGIDILYNNASAQRFSPFPEIPADEWAFTMRNDLNIVFPVTQYAWNFLVARGGGSIINTASVGGLTSQLSWPSVAHSTAKAGIMGFTRSLAAEGIQHNIRVNCIAPGIIETPVVMELMDEKSRQAVVQGTPMKRWGRPEEIAYYALFLASDESSFVTGTTLPIDGGATVITA